MNSEASFIHSRNIYAERIRPFIGKPVVKILTGMRRAGKSCLLKLLMVDLLEREKVPATNILYIDKESLEFEDIVTYRDLDRIARPLLGKKGGRKYLLIDEVQEIGQWERAVAPLSARADLDIILTGSNAHLFSSELATLLTGRYLEFPVYTLGFTEFLAFHSAAVADRREAFRLYLRYGGLPGLHHFPLRDETALPYSRSVFDSILLKDVVRRHAVRNVPLLESLGRFIMDNIGSVISAKRIADHLKAQRLTVSVETVQHYLGHFCEALLAYRVPRYDLKGRRLLEIHEKYYLGDLGLRHAVLGYREADISGILENVVFLELKRRGYEVCIGKLQNAEVDFVATRVGDKLYIQVAYLLASPATVAREFGPLKAIKDHYPKLVLSLDPAWGSDLDGIRRLDLMEFLLAENA